LGKKGKGVKAKNMFVVEIFTPEKRVFKGDVSHLVAPGRKGWFGILTNHAPFLSSLNPGDIKLDMGDNSKKYFNVPGGGFIEVDNNHVIILADSIAAKEAPAPMAAERHV
jgi:F-type H+-transporting ATPase subunit epsilon